MVYTERMPTRESDEQEGSTLDLGDDMDQLDPEDAAQRLKALRGIEANEALEEAEKGRALKGRVNSMLREMKRDGQSYIPFRAAIKEDDGAYSLVLKNQDRSERWEINFFVFGDLYFVDEDEFESENDAFDQIQTLARGYLELGI